MSSSLCFPRGPGHLQAGWAGSWHLKDRAVLCGSLFAAPPSHHVLANMVGEHVKARRW